MVNNNKKLQEEIKSYLEREVFYGLTNLNDGFDIPSIKYFSKEDFKIVLKRVKEKGIRVCGIEPWKNGEFFDVAVCEQFDKQPTDSTWYMEAFNEFIKTGENLAYSATYEVPDNLLIK